MQVIAVAAKDVREGDQIYNSLADRKEFRWTTVRSVSWIKGAFTLEGGKTVELPAIEIVATYSTVLHPEEGIMVRRF